MKPDSTILSQPGALIVRGHSMYPALQDGDIVIGKPVQLQSVTPGDVVVVQHRTEEVTICHRVISVDMASDSFCMRGDAALHVDTVSLQADVSTPELLLVQAYIRGQDRPVPLFRWRNLYFLWRQRAMTIVRKLRGRFLGFQT